MSFTQTWMIDGKLVCQAPIGLEYIHAQAHPPYSYAYFCPQCGELWARRIISPATRWVTLTHECIRHEAPRYCEPGGSIWKNLDTDFLKHLPKEILRREALLRLELDK